MSIFGVLSEKECHESGFTFVWKLQNFSHCTIPKGKSLSSPEFENPYASDMKWRLIFYPRGNDDSFLECILKSETCEILTIDCQICVFTSKQKMLYTEGREELYYYNRSSCPVAKFASDTLENLHEDAVVMHCHIWTHGSNKKENPVNRFALHRFSLLRMIFHWKIDNFSRLSLGEKKVYCLPSAKENLPSISLELFLDGWNLGNSFVQIWLKYKGVKEETISTFALSIKDGYGRERKSIRREYCLTLGECFKNLNIRRQELIAGGSLNDTLVLSGEVTLPSDSDDVIAFGLQTREAVSAVMGPSHPHPSLSPSLDMLPLFNGEGPPPDFELIAAGRGFPVHQLVLWARSSVFRAMLDVDMLEKSDRSVELEDVDADTAERMLLYAYTGAEPQPGLECESLLDLYAAADRYAFMGLKGMCAERLVGILDPVNAPSVVQIADRHGDQRLKERATDYIFSQGQVALESDHWKKLEREDPQLAVDILHRIICDKFLSGSRKNN